MGTITSFPPLVLFCLVSVPYAMLVRNSLVQKSDLSPVPVLGEHGILLLPLHFGHVFHPRR